MNFFEFSGYKNAISITLNNFYKVSNSICIRTITNELFHDFVITQQQQPREVYFFIILRVKHTFCLLLLSIIYVMLSPDLIKMFKKVNEFQTYRNNFKDETMSNNEFILGRKGDRSVSNRILERRKLIFV